MAEASGALTWLAPALVPLAAMLLLLPGLRRLSGLRLLLPLAALPALGVALFAPPGAVDLPWLFLGARFGLDGTGRIFLLFTAALWLAGGVHALGYLHDDPRRNTFWLFWCAAMAGNFGLVLAQDAASFYVFFALMSFAAYGLVVHSRTPEALHAGRVYLALVVLGELALFAAIALAWQAAGSLNFADIGPALAASPWRDAVIALTLLGFGIKVGALPLHVWLPLAHPVAPTPASAVLSGAMIKAGLLGWLRLLPLEGPGAGAPVWGEALVLLGLTAAFAAALVGATQRQAKAALAYSSISQMGLVTVAVGIALAAPAAAPAAVAAATLYAFHHAFAKAALFLGVSLGGAATPGHRALWMLGLALPALALAGAPLTSGFAAKAALKAALPETWAWLGMALSLAAAGTTLVLLRTLWLLKRDAGSHAAHPPNPAMWAGWALLVAASAAGWFMIGDARDLLPATTSDWAAAIWPIVLGAILALLVWAWRRRRVGADAFTVPPGDLLVPLLALAGAVAGSKRHQQVPPAGHAEHGTEEVAQATVPSWPGLARAESALARGAGLALALLGAAMVALLIVSA
ncbi:MAG: complex I subunit 5 family protein [Hydrogenophaga sp.]|uniref:complex I subunit 5 family protein n=1 Tax=Hydrogenophaga sp. TaxID=1904254 RepID=UPI00273090C8|nr:complex I subunit 5 family protein [Hydrogenophaga sp.]MDP2164271.1 complex I subunit 5 family protein [Hydrogenophaga sp.]MDP3477493.1 complex I subunit 5 family protein [Hydrogenophaga sp.]